MTDIGSIVTGVSFLVATIGVFVAMGFYAVRNLRGFKGGLMSSGWKYISIAVFFFIAGQLFLVSGASQAIKGLGIIAMYNATTGSVLETMGGALLVLGFRAQNRIWNSKKIATKVIQKAKEPEAIPATRRN